MLHVCVTCRMGHDLPDGARPLGLDLFEAVSALGAGVAEVRGVKCLAACGRGCAAAIESPGKWTTLLGGLEPGLALDVVEYAAAYAASGSGAVLPSRRAPSLRNVIIGRVPG